MITCGSLFSRSRSYHSSWEKRVFLEGMNGLDPDKEREANEFSENELVPKKVLSDFVQDTRLTKASIKKFADELKISPGIIVGQLQHEQLLPRSHCNDLKQRFQWAAETWLNNSSLVPSQDKTT